MAVAASALPAAAKARPPMRGELVDIGGGRHIRVLCQGPPSAKPLVVLESGIFAGAASWNAVQDDLAAQGLRSCAYDRAGVGYSDPGPSPRDAKAIEGDLEAWLRAKGETGPFVLAAHSMGGLEIRMFAERHPDQVAGLVMVDTTSASLAVTHRGRMFLKTYTAFGRFVEALSRLRLLKLLAPSVADQANHRGPAHAELIYFFGDREDEKVSADEIEHIYLRAKQTLDAGPLDPDIPVTAIVLKDELGQSSPWAAARTAEARASHYGREIDVVNTEHPRLIDRDHASTVVEAIQSVIAADGLRRRARGG